MALPSALDLFPPTHDVLRGGFHGRVSPAGAAPHYASLGAAQRALGAARYDRALLLATAEKLQQSYRILAATPSEPLHEYAAITLRNPLYQDFERALAAARVRFQREWGVDPLLLLHTADFEAGGIPPWTDIVELGQRLGVDTDLRQPPSGGANLELARTLYDMGKLRELHLRFDRELAANREAATRSKAGEAFWTWPQEVVEVAAAHAYDEDQDWNNAVAQLMPQLTVKDAKHTAALQLLQAAVKLKELRDAGTAATNQQLLAEQQLYNQARSALL